MAADFPSKHVFCSKVPLLNNFRRKSTDWLIVTRFHLNRFDLRRKFQDAVELSLFTFLAESEIQFFKMAAIKQRFGEIFAFDGLRFS